MIDKTFNDAWIQLTSCQFSKTVVYHNEFHSHCYSKIEFIRLSPLLASHLSDILHATWNLKPEKRLHTGIILWNGSRFSWITSFSIRNTKPKCELKIQIQVNIWTIIIGQTREDDSFLKQTNSIYVLGDKVALIWITFAIIGH